MVTAVCLVEIVRVVRKRVKVMVNPLISGMSDSKSVGQSVNNCCAITTLSSLFQTTATPL